MEDKTTTEIRDNKEYSIDLDKVLVRLDDIDVWNIWDELEENGLTGGIVIDWEVDVPDTSNIRKNFVVPLVVESWKTLDDLVVGVKNALSNLGITGVSDEDIKKVVQDKWNESYMISLQDEYIDIFLDLENDVNDEDYKEFRNLENSVYNTESIDELEGIISRAKELANAGTTPPEGYTRYNGNTNSLEVGQRVITNRGDEYYIVELSDWGGRDIWVSQDRRDIETGRGYSLDANDIRFVKLDESLNEAYINAPKEVLDIIRADKEYGQNYIMRDYTPDFSAIPSGTVIEVKAVNKYHPEVKDTYTKVGENEWKYTHDYGKGSWTTSADNQDVVHHIAEIDRGAYESLKQETDMNKLTESESLQEKQESSDTKKESAKVREAISLITGNLAKSGGYKIEDTKIIIDPEGERTTFEFSKQVINRLKELGYGEDMKESMNKLTEAVNRNKLADFIKKAVEDLKVSDAYNEIAPTWFFDMGAPNGLHLVIGYDSADNYYAKDLENLALDKSGKYVVCAKLAVNVDDMQDDFDWDWYMPFDSKTGDVWDTQTTVAKNEDYDAFAQDFINEFEKMKDLNLDEDGAIIEHEEVVEESVEKKLDVEDVIGWISDHDELYDDFKRHFNYEYDEGTGEEKNRPALKDIKDWLSEHETAYADFNAYFGLKEPVDESCKDKKASKKKLDEAYGLEDRMDAIDTAMGFFYSIGLNDFADNLLKEFEMNEDDSGDLGYFTDVPADNINRLYDRCREEVVARLNDGVDLGRYKDEIIELFDINQVYESCNKGKVDECKDKTSLKEDMNPVQKAVYNYMSKDGGYVNDDMFDLLCNLVERVDDYNDDDDIRSAVDDGMIYTDDQWTAYRYFCDMGDSVDVMWEALYLAVVEICTELFNADTEDNSIDEKVEQSITESTGLKVKDVLNFELEDDGTETGGIPYKGYTVEDFLDEVAFSSDGVTFQFEDDADKDIALESPVEDLNAILVQCGIKPIKK